MSRIVVVVEGGVVQSIYATNKEVDVEVIDCDTDDPEHGEEIDKALAQLKKDYDSEELCEVY